jgi:hypothetical protein
MDAGDRRAVNIWNGRSCMGVKYSGQHSALDGHYDP